MTSKLSFWTAYVDFFNHVCNLYSFQSNLLRSCISFILMFNLGFLISFDVWYPVNRPGITLKKEKIILGIDTIIVVGVIFGKWIRDPFLIVVGTTALRGTTDELVKSPLQTEFISSGAKRFRSQNSNRVLWSVTKWSKRHLISPTSSWNRLYFIIRIA